MRIIFFTLFIWLVAVGCQLTTKRSGIVAGDLTCEYLTNPAVVDVAHPRLAWINTLTSLKERGQKQTAYQIRVASSEEQLESPDLWDSEKVNSYESIRIKYHGDSLASRQECWWQVKVWDKYDRPSEWSTPAKWRMGLLQEEDWKAKWIGAPWQGEEALPKPPGGPDARPADFGPPAPLFRKEFEIKKPIEKAVAFVTGLGYFEFYANGEKVGNDVLVPNQTNYGKRPNLPNALINVDDNFLKYKVMYLAYDLKDLLKPGKNVVGSILGNGFYNPAKFWAEGYGTPRFLGQIHITYTDGSEEVIVSDESWKVSTGAILMDMVYYGEYYDARKEQPGWNTANFDEAGWEYAALRKAPAGELVAQTFYADKVTERIQPVSIKKIENGNYLVDFGVEISGWVRLNQVEAPAGHKIEISFNGNQYSGDNSYIFKGQGPESYAPRFNWFVFSGVEIKNWPGELKPEQLTAEAVNTEVQVSANFQTSNELFNDINKIWRRSQIDNMHGGVASDCPHRERSPYTGDAQVACATVMHNYDAQNFYYKWMKDMADAQDKDSGYVPNCAPWQPGCGGGVAWGAAICIIPWEFYQQYGARDVLVDHYGNMKEYIRYMLHWIDEKGIMFSQRKGASGDVLKWYNLGEWVAPGELIRPDLVHTFYFWHCAKITGQTAEILGNAEESKYYHQLAEKTAAAFHDNFYDEVNKSYGNHGGNVFALRMGVPTERRADVLNSLEQSITKNDGHLDTGIFGTRFIFEVLAENGLNQLAYNAMNKTDEPSYGRWIALGSTTTREQWGEGGSHNHPMFGGGLVWFYRNLAGMQSDRSGPGYKKIIFRPQPVDELDFVRYENKTPHGVAGIHWINNKHEFTMELKVPVGSSATVYIPAGENDRLYENGVEEFLSENIRLVSVESDTRIYAVESGSYAFRVINGF